MALFDDLKGVAPKKPEVMRKTVAAKPTVLAEGEGSDVCIFGDADAHFAHEIHDEADHEEECGFESDELIRHIVIGEVLNTPRFKRKR